MPRHKTTMLSRLLLLAGSNWRWWVSDINGHYSLLEDLLEIQIAWPCPQSFWFNGFGAGARDFAFLMSSRMMLMLLVWGLNLRSCWVGAGEGKEEGMSTFNKIKRSSEGRALAITGRGSRMFQERRGRLYRMLLGYQVSKGSKSLLEFSDRGHWWLCGFIRTWGTKCRFEEMERSLRNSFGTRILFELAYHWILCYFQFSSYYTISESIVIHVSMQTCIDR